LNGSVNIVTADVAATNGVVHIIDAVLVPPSILPVVGTVVAPAYFNKNFTTLVAVVVQADLLETLLDADANYTLFAPTNDAFAAAGINELPADDAEGNALLTSILLYHVLDTEVLAAQLPATEANAPAAVETLGGTIYVTNRGGSSGVFINGSTEVVATDIQATNGVVHVIDRTLVPPTQTIAEIAIDLADNNPAQFTQLVAALSKVPSLLTAADSEGNLTVFAPTDAAFQALYTALGVANINELEAEIGNDKLAQVLQHHIVNARIFSSDLQSGSAGTLNGNVTINVTNLTVTGASSNNNVANLQPTLLNILATNGVIHVIDEVLIPTGIL
jgi:transforming growth factor-beta-induced protein